MLSRLLLSILVLALFISAPVALADDYPVLFPETMVICAGDPANPELVCMATPDRLGDLANALGISPAQIVFCPAATWRNHFLPHQTELQVLDAHVSQPLATVCAMRHIKVIPYPRIHFSIGEHWQAIP